MNNYMCFFHLRVYGGDGGRCSRARAVNFRLAVDMHRDLILLRDDDTVVVSAICEIDTGHGHLDVLHSHRDRLRGRRKGSESESEGEVSASDFVRPWGSIAQRLHELLAQLKKHQQEEERGMASTYPDSLSFGTNTLLANGIARQIREALSNLKHHEYHIIIRRRIARTVCRPSSASLSLLTKRVYSSSA